MPKTLIAAALLLAAALPYITSAETPSTPEAPASQLRVTAFTGTLPADTAHISRDYVAPAQRHRSYETGALHIVYSDGVEVVLERQPRDKDAGAWQVGFRKVRLADDGRTIGWIETYNYSDKWPVAAAFGVGIYTSGKSVIHIGGDVAPGMVWFWEFTAGGKQMVVVWGPGHGGVPGAYDLYDTSSGRLLGEAIADPQSGDFIGDTPAWAHQAQDDCGRCTL